MPTYLFNPFLDQNSFRNNFFSLFRPLINRSLYFFLFRLIHLSFSSPVPLLLKLSFNDIPNPNLDFNPRNMSTPIFAKFILSFSSLNQYFPSNLFEYKSAIFSLSSKITHQFNHPLPLSYLPLLIPTPYLLLSNFAYLTNKVGYPLILSLFVLKTKLKPFRKSMI